MFCQVSSESMADCGLCGYHNFVGKYLVASGVCRHGHPARAQVASRTAHRHAEPAGSGKKESCARVSVLCVDVCFFILSLPR